MISRSHGTLFDRVPSRRRATVVQLSIGYINIALFIIQGIVMVPLYLHYIGAHLYGLWLATGGVTFWLGMSDFGISTLMGQRIAAAYGRRDGRSLCLYYFNGLLLQVVAMGVLTMLGGGIAWFLPRFLGLAGGEAHMLRWTTMLAALALGLTLVNNGQKNAADALQRPLVPASMNILGRLATIGLTIGLLLNHIGLYAIPWGLLLGAIVTLLGNSAYVFALMRQGGGALRLDRAALQDMLKLSPAMLAGKAGYALVGQLEPTLITHYLSPELAVVWSITKRGGDIIQIILDNAVGSIRPSFAHLFAEGDLAKARRILRSFIGGCFAAMIILLATYIAANRSFITLWVGAGHFAGQGITGWLALAVIALHFNSSFSTLLGAVGDFARPSLMIGVEAMLRVMLMTLLLSRLGMVGLPIAVCVSAGGFAVLYALRLIQRLMVVDARWLGATRMAIGGLVVLSGAMALGYAWKLETYPGLLLLAAVAATFAGLSVLGFDGPIRRTLVARLQRTWKPLES